MAEEMKVMIPEQLDRLAERRARKAAVARRYRAKRRARTWTSRKEARREESSLPT